jgi:DAK2 domain fusion protein YloV
MSDLRGRELRQAFARASVRLEEYRETINALNVFPVPDGDTGTNMLLTMRAAMERCPDDENPTVSEVASQMAQGAFFGARGNSGVILSQFFKGLSDALQEKECLSGDDLAHAFGRATEAAYGSVGNPVEGTMLTVIRQAAEAVQRGVDSDDSSQIIGLLETAFEASREALMRTPEQLPLLREAGVVDSGGLGIVVIIGGALEALAPEKLQANGQQTDLTSLFEVNLDQFDGLGGKNLTADGNLIKKGYLDTTVETEWGYCTEFIINGEGLDLEGVRVRFQGTALSTVVVGDDRHIRVHLHTEDPGPALSYAVSLGSVSDIKIENMDLQTSDFAASHGSRAAVPLANLAVLAVTCGKGIAELFRDSGCAAVVEGGQTMNPSVEQILGAVEAARAKQVIVLPNNKNIIATARQAAVSNPALQVVPSATIPQGVAALLAYNPEQPLEDNLRAMEEARTQVSSLAVTQAVRGTTIGGVAVGSGDFIGLLEDNLAATGGSPEEALRATLALVELNSDAILTIYRGRDADAESAERFARRLEEEFPGIQVDQVDGGQLHYHYLASVE